MRRCQHANEAAESRLTCSSLATCTHFFFGHASCSWPSWANVKSEKRIHTYIYTYIYNLVDLVHWITTMIRGILFVGAVLTVTGRSVRAEDVGHCFTSADIAGSVLGTFFATLAAVTAGYIVYWYISRRKKGKGQPLRPSDVEAHAYDNPYFQEDEPDKAVPADIKAENGTTNSDNGKLQADKNKAANEVKTGKKNKLNNPFTNVFSNSKAHTLQRALDDSCIQQEPEKLEVRLRGSDFTGLGFNICGNIRHGIYVRDVLHRGPASESGKIKAGDRILGVTVSFDKITIEDALTILSYASPYDVTLFMQKTSEQPGGFLPDHQKKGSIVSTTSSSGMGGAGEHLFHPVYRSQSSDDVSQMTRDVANSKLSLSVGVVPPNRMKKDSMNRMSPTPRVESISEGDSPLEEVHVQIHNEVVKEVPVQRDVIAVVVNELPEKFRREEENLANRRSTNPFVSGRDVQSRKGGTETDGEELRIDIDDEQMMKDAGDVTDRKNSTQTSVAFIPPKDLTVEIPTFGLNEIPDEDESKVLKSTTSNVDGSVLGPCVEPTERPSPSADDHHVIVRTVNGDGIDIPDMSRVFVPELTSDESMNEFDVKIPAMDLDDIQLSLEASLQQGLSSEKIDEVSAFDIADRRSKETGETVNSIAADVVAIKQTIIASLDDPVKVQEMLKIQDVEESSEGILEVEDLQRIEGQTSKTVILPRVEMKTPSIADFEGGTDPLVKSKRAPQPPASPPVDDSLNENISYFETKIQSALQKSPKLKPKRNSIPGKRRAPPPPLVHPSSSPTEDDEHSKMGNPFVVGIPSLSSQGVTTSQGNVLNSTSVVFLKPNNVTTVQVNAGPPTSPKSPKMKNDGSFGLGFRMTNYYEGLDKAGGDDVKGDAERFHSIPRSGFSMQGDKKGAGEKGSSARRAASLDDLTKIEEMKPLVLERAVSMDLNNPDEPPADQLGDDEDDGRVDDSSATFLKKVKVSSGIDGGGGGGGESYKKSWENLREVHLNSPKVDQDLEQWVDENLPDRKSPKKFNLIDGSVKDKGVKRKTDEKSGVFHGRQEVDGNSNGDRVFVAVPLDRTLSVSTSSLSEDSIESEQVVLRQPAKRQMIAVDPSTKTYHSDSDSDEDARGGGGSTRTFWVSSTLGGLSVKNDAPNRLSPTVTIPIIPPIINARDLRTPSPHKEMRDGGGGGMLESYRPTKFPKLLNLNDEQKSPEENGEHDEHNGTATGTSYRFTINNKTGDGISTNDVSVNTMHVTVQGSKKDGEHEPYSVSSQGVVSKTVFIAEPQMAAMDSRLADPESPPPILQPPE